MQTPSASDREIEELELALGDLTITVRRRRAEAAASPSSSFSASPFTVVPPQPEPADTRPAGVPLAPQPLGDWEQQLLQALTPQALDQADLGPRSVFVRRLHAAGEPWTARARIARAVRAGIAAAIALRGDSEFVVRSLPLSVSNRIYIALRSGSSPASFYTANYSRYFDRVSDPATGQFRTGSISHAFASRAEAEAYCSAAGQPPQLSSEAIVALLAQDAPGKPLPLLYMYALDDPPPWRATAFLLKIRAGGFMVAVPASEEVIEFFTALSDDLEGEESGSLPVVWKEVLVACETSRRRRMGDVTVLLADLSWPHLEHFRRATSSRPPAGVVLLAITQDGAAVRPIKEAVREAADDWVNEQLSDATFLEYATAEELPEHQDEEAEAPEEEADTVDSRPAAGGRAGGEGTNAPTTRSEADPFFAGARGWGGFDGGGLEEAASCAWRTFSLPRWTRAGSSDHRRRRWAGCGGAWAATSRPWCACWPRRPNFWRS